ncbi:UDP-N-acetylmuramoyl-tripeptide--D-alanyl-D-alanine ligase [Profundibacterium mesophilum]|uniref:UDP-N-acetylmuramoyl-tripeptide--D-alanyl-D-alanine ligase n=1 Tax=Profundibacterium mesophilum KAUST100406-0324 TaxID=1037889 RepID=A0A921TBE2_9RHOB|nr:UDP-N-acetylmuramoyl-tripeptide--D-alanyl-D-alanine ligase [Profundibacterium mesophilum]KAF0675450.1 UDP-N-acetylmuramoyl-tripeptide--D-alanyl-D-alanine ligase [Profundibacterium mesophilum KAUST100406-0324]
MSLWTSAQAVIATGGKATRAWSASGISIDTRTLRPGDLFVALKAERDGHDFVAAALEKGAAAALVSRRPDDVPPDAPLLVVPDVLAALEALGRAGRARCTGRVVAITGSAGKTSTKDMLASALPGQADLHVAQASYNNHWGVPLTLARMPPDTDVAIIEIGMNHPGEIAPLARMAQPHICIVTTVGAAHLAAFGSIEGIAREKAAIFDGFAAQGTAIVNGDLEVTPILHDAARAHDAAIVHFGQGEDCALRLEQMRIAGGCTVVQARMEGEELIFKIETTGRHMAMNALAVLGAVRALGADVALAAHGLGSWRPTQGRGTRERVVLDLVDDHLWIDLIDDAFNANPASVSAALEMLAASEPAPGGRRVAILGDMLELGPDEAALHARLAEHPALAQIDAVHCLGPRMAALHEALRDGVRGIHTADAQTMARELTSLIAPGDIVLVKGSKGIRASHVVDVIRNLGQRHGLMHQKAD